MGSSSVSDECIRRWQSENGRKRSQEILELLKNGNASRMQEVCEVHNGRWDLRGFVFPRPVKYENGKWDFQGMTVVPHSGIFEADHVNLDGFDLSYAVLDHTVWTKSVFENCIAFGASLRDTRFYAGAIIDCSFEDCDFSGTLLSGRIRNDSGELHGMVLKGGRFSDVAFESPAITDCIFGCDMHNVDFGGSQLQNCRFSGRLDKVIFRRKVKDTGMIGKFLAIANEMRNIDFSQACFLDVDFRGGLELDDCILPTKGDTTLITDVQSVLEQARDVVSSGWTGEDRQVAIAYLDMLLNDSKRGGQQHFVLNGDMIREVWGLELGNRFLSLIKDMQGQS